MIDILSVSANKGQSVLYSEYMCSHRSEGQYHLPSATASTMMFASGDAVP